MFQQLAEFIEVSLSVVERFCVRQFFRLQSVDAAVGSVDAAGVVAAVVDALFVEVGDVDAAVRAGFDVDWSEPLVVGFYDSADVASLKRRLVRLEVTHDDLTLQRLNAEESSSIFVGQNVLFVDDEVMRESWNAVMLHVGVVAESVRVRKRTMLTEPFSRIPTLFVVKTSSIAAVVAGEDFALLADLDAECVAAAFREDFAPKMRVAF